jgi:sporulation protein YlmC with PRC-barrel domain
LSKTQKEVTASKGKLIGKTVIDQEGNLVGTVKDVGFTDGKSGISIVVEDKDGESQDIAMDSIQGAADFVVLKSMQQSTSSVTQPTQQVQPVQFVQPVQAAQPAQVAQPFQQAQPSQPLCPICRGPLTWIPQYKRWYCYKDQKYA